MAPRPNRPIWTWCQNWRRPHKMKSVVRPELPTASVGSSQAPTAAVDNSAPLLITPESTYKSGKSVQTTGATSDWPLFLGAIALSSALSNFFRSKLRNSSLSFSSDSRCFSLSGVLFLVRPFGRYFSAATVRPLLVARFYEIRESVWIVSVVVSIRKLVQVQGQIVFRDLVISPTTPRFSNDQKFSMLFVCTFPRTYSPFCAGRF